MEVTDNNRCVTVFVSNVKGVESPKICCSVIKLVLSLQKQFCPCKINEYIIPCGSLAKIHGTANSKRILYPVSAVAQGIIGNGEILDHNGFKAMPNTSVYISHTCPLHQQFIHALFFNSKVN